MNWSFENNKLILHFNIDNFTKSFLHYKMRKLFGLGNYLYLPKNFEISHKHLSLEFDKNLTQNTLIDIEKAKSNLFALLNKGMKDFSPFIIENKFIPGVNFFLPSNNQLIEIEEMFSFLNFSARELEAINKKDFNHLINTRSPEKKISAFDIILFAELLFDRLLIYSFEYDKRDIKKLLIKQSKKNKLFPSFNLPSVQELWDAFVETNRSMPQLNFYDKNNIDIFDQYKQNNNNSNPSIQSNWIFTHQDKQIIKIDTPIKNKNYKYFSPVDLGTKILSKRKLFFTGFFSESSHLAHSIKKYYKENDENITRENLPKLIANNKGIFLVQGPPGTGKTYLASQVIEQTLSANPNARILVVAKEHLALNHLLQVSLKNLLQKKLKHFAVRILDSSKYNIHASEIDNLNLLLSQRIVELKQEKWLNDYAYWEMKFNNNPSQYDLRLKKLIIESANLIFITSMDREWKRLINNSELFDLVIVEEASKAYPSELFHAIASGINTLLIGDQQQLPPFQLKETQNFISDIKNIVENNMDTSQSVFNDFFENVKKAYLSNPKIFDEAQKWTEPFATLFNEFPQTRKFLLNEEYRLENELTKIISDTFYNGKLIPKKNTVSKYKNALPEPINKSLLWIDTPHIIENEEAGEDPERTGKRINVYELNLIIKYFEHLKNLKMDKQENDSIVILTPYNEQKRLISSNEKLKKIVNEICNQKLEDIVKTVDEFQGHEAEITIVSLVRNNVLNSNNAWGFISSPERLNVMFSRAKYSLVIIGSTQHIIRNNNKKNRYLVEFLNNFKKYGHIIKAEKF